MGEFGYSMHEVVQMTGVKRSTLYKWRELRLIPGPIPGTYKRTARYDDEYVRAVQRIKDDLIDHRTTRKEFAERLAIERGRRRLQRHHSRTGRVGSESRTGIPDAPK
jgi:predicted DNA-binding transcriptional regulator AlpA